MGEVKTDEKKPPEEKPIDGQFREESSSGTSLAVAAQPMEVALSTQDPAAFIKRATAQADALKAVIDAKNLAVSIGGGSKKHVLIDGWQTLMALNGVMPRTVDLKRELCDSRTCPYPKCEGGRLTVKVTTELHRVQDNLLLTSVEAECSQHEPRWSKAEHYAVTSMAQTRGIGKACRQLYGWVMALAGYDATPAEEMPERPHGDAQAPARPAPAPARKSTAAAKPPEAPAPAPAPKTESIPWNEPMKEIVRARVRFLQAERSPVLYNEWKAFMTKVPGENKWESLYQRAELYIEAFTILGIPEDAADIAQRPVQEKGFDPSEVPA